MRKLLITILSLIMALSVFAMVGCEFEIADYPETSSGSVEQGSTESTEDSSTGGTEEHTHTYGNWEITKPTQTEEGTAQKVCKECEGDVVGKEITVTLPILTDAGYQTTEDTATCNLAGKITYKFPYNEETIEFDVETTAKGHTWDNGEVTSVPTTEKEGEMTYTCTVCSKQKTEAIPKLVDTDIVTADTAITFTAKENITTEKKLAVGVKVVASDAKSVAIETLNPPKHKDEIEFNCVMKLGGKINVDSRYIEIKAGMACKVKIYAMSGKTAEARVMNMFKSLADISGDPLQKQDILKGENLTVLEFHIAEAGTYYFGSFSGGIDVFGIYITKAPHAHNFDTANWASNEESHYHECLIEGCTEALERELHAFDAGAITKPATAETAGEMTYTCTVCGKVKKEEIPKISTGTTTSVRFSTPDGQIEKFTTTKDFVNGVKAVATESGYMEIEKNDEKLPDQSETFNYRLELTGKMNADSRYIEVTVEKACTIKVYAMSAKKTETRNLIISKSTPNINTPMNSVSVGGANLEVVEFTITEAGTYYIGSGKSGINVYGIDIIYS